MANQPIITVITVVYNAAAALEHTMDSVAAQDFKDFEYLVVDGGSTDGTLELVKSRPEVVSRFVSEPDRGIYDAMNKGIALAAGQWLMFMNAGDLFYSSETLGQVAAAARAAAAGTEIVYGSTQVVYAEGHAKIAVPDYPPKFKFYLPFCHQSVIVRSAYHRDNPYNTAYHTYADFDMFYRAWKRGIGFERCEVVVSVYNFLGFSATNDKISKYRESFAIVREHQPADIPRFIVFLVSQIIKSLIKRVLPKSLVRRVQLRNAGIPAKPQVLGNTGN